MTTQYEARVRELEAEGLTRSDAQAIADVEGLDDSTPIETERKPVDVLAEATYRANLLAQVEGALNLGANKAARDLREEAKAVERIIIDEAVATEAALAREPVDVLAALRAAIGQAHGASLDHSNSEVLAKHHARMIAARAAVAELIEAAQEAADAMPKVPERLRAALARVGGA